FSRGTKKPATYVAGFCVEGQSPVEWQNTLLAAAFVPTRLQSFHKTVICFCRLLAGSTSNTGFTWWLCSTFCRLVYTCAHDNESDDTQPNSIDCDACQQYCNTNCSGQDTQNNIACRYATSRAPRPHLDLRRDPRVRGNQLGFDLSQCRILPIG